MNKWKLFLEQSGFTNEVIKTSQVEDVFLDEEQNLLEINVSLSNVAPLFEYLKLLEAARLSFFNEIYKDVSFNITYKSITDFSKYSHEYYLYIIDKIAKAKPCISYLTNYKTRFQADNKTLYIISGKDFNHLKDYIIPVKKEFQAIGLNIEVTIEYKEELESVYDAMAKKRKIEKEMLFKKAELLSAEKALTSSSKTSFSKTKYIKKSEGKRYAPIEIDIIPKNQFELDGYNDKKYALDVSIYGCFSKPSFEKRKEKYIFRFLLSTQTDTVYVKKFVTEEERIGFIEIESGSYVFVKGKIIFDEYDKDVLVMADSIEKDINPQIKTRMDNSTEKRVELSIHTKMSNLDSPTAAKDYICLAESFNHKAIAFTDADSVAAFPEIEKAAKGKGIKPIYGCELSIVYEDEFKIVSTKENFDLKKQDYVVFDVETTGLSKNYDELIEIGAIRISNGIIQSTFSKLIKPRQEVSEKIYSITKINKDDLSMAEYIENILPDFLSFIKGAVLVAHNAKFDIGMLQQTVKKVLDKKMEFSYIDTLTMSQYFLSQNLKRFNLDALCKYFKVKLDGHHRAYNDAKATADCFLEMLQLLPKDITDAFSLRDYVLKNNDGYKYLIPYKINVLAKNKEGCKDLFRILSYSLTDYFYKVPRIPSYILEKFRKNILVGSGGEFGPVFQAGYLLLDEDIEKYVKRFDYIEISPKDCYNHLISDLSDRGNGIITDIQRRIIEISAKQKKPVVATGSVAYLNREDKEYRNIYTRAPKIGGGVHYLKKYKDKPNCYFRTTPEMLDSFPDLSVEKAYEIVVKNTNKIADKIEAFNFSENTLYALPDNAFSDKLNIPSAQEEIKKLVKENLKKIYGDNPHPIIKQRLEYEIKIITKNNYAPIYYLAYLLVQKSLSDGYVVGSRGSVGSSLVATILDITEVNPLSPHYYCPNKDFQAFEIEEHEKIKLLSDKEKEINNNIKASKTGIDLKTAYCPRCGAKLKGDGHGVPFETFLGFHGDKVPDIDLNFSGEYQSKAHDYIRELLGEDKTFRAGVIQTVANKTAFGYVLGYLQDNPQISMRRARQEYIAEKIKDVQRTSGQHAGGIVVLPENITIYDVTPVQYPADNIESSWKTTHFDYHSYENNLLKMDILGHDNPTVIKFLMDYVKKNPDEFPFDKVEDIPLNDPKVYELFCNTKTLNLGGNDIMTEIGTYAIPEFGTANTMKMLESIRPRNFAAITKVSGLAHGKNIWQNNIENLIAGTTEYGKIPSSEVIGCRDDIMTVLISKYKMDSAIAFRIMEFVRKGKAREDFKKWFEYEKILKEHNVPNWYIESASKIEYLFPKAHAVAYVVMALKIAWFKVYHPILFYSAFFSKRAKQFVHEVMVEGKDAIYEYLTKLKQIKPQSAKEKEQQKTLEVALEMTARGYKFLPSDIYKSGVSTFEMEGDALRMPFLSIEQLGAETAKKIVEERQKSEFVDREDAKERCGINKTVFEKMEKIGTFSSIKEDEDGLGKIMSMRNSLFSED